MSNAPTTKVQNNVIDNKLFFELANGVTAYATELDYNCYVITYHNDMMPAHDTDTFDSIQELANAMRDIADLRTWRTLYDVNGEARI